MKLLKRIAIGTVLAIVLVYAGDYVSLRSRLPKSLETVTIEPYYAVPQRNGKSEEYMMLDPYNDTCVDSMLPHMGHAPCWYLKKHINKRIDL